LLFTVASFVIQCQFVITYIHHIQKIKWNSNEASSNSRWPLILVFILHQICLSKIKVNNILYIVLSNETFCYNISETCNKSSFKNCLKLSTIPRYYIKSPCHKESLTFTVNHKQPYSLSSKISNKIQTRRAQGMRILNKRIANKLNTTTIGHFNANILIQTKNH